MGKQQPKGSRFAFSPTETRSLLVLAAIVLIGLVSGQVRRMLQPSEAKLVVQGAVAVDPDSLIASAETASNDSSSVAKGQFDSVISTPKVAERSPEPAQPEKEELEGGSAATPLDLNSATIEQLKSLPGIGPVLAGRIVEFRQKNGGFVRLEDLLLVPGIGAKRLKTLTPLVTVEQTHTKGEFQ